MSRICGSIMPTSHEKRFGLFMKLRPTNKERAANPAYEHNRYKWYRTAKARDMAERDLPSTWLATGYWSLVKTETIDPAPSPAGAEG